MQSIKTIMIIIVSCLTFCSTSILAGPLHGTIGSGAGAAWQSSWLDLNSNENFNKGDVLTITVQGNAENTLVRLLPAHSSPSSPTGVEGAVRKVPHNGIIKVMLTRKHINIRQISLHAGHKAWDTELGGNNGTVKIISINHQK